MLNVGMVGADLEEGIELVKIAAVRRIPLWVRASRPAVSIDNGLIGEVIGGRCCMATHGVETGRPGRTTYKQTFHVLEAMAGIMKSAGTGLPYKMTSRFEREAPMDPTLEHGKL